MPGSDKTESDFVGGALEQPQRHNSIKALMTNTSAFLSTLLLRGTSSSFLLSKNWLLAELHEIYIFIPTFPARKQAAKWFILISLSSGSL